MIAEILETIVAGSNSPHKVVSDNVPFVRHDINGQVVIEVRETVELVHQPYAARSERNEKGHASIILEKGFYVIHKQQEYNVGKGDFVDNVD